MARTPKICEANECDRVVVARSLCRRHYARLQRTGTLEVRPWQRQAQCTVEGCDKDAWSGGLCEMHRWRVREHGEPGPADPVKNRRRKERDPCSVEGCERLRKGRLYCHLHTERIRRTGSPGPVEPMFVKGRVKPGKEGYVRRTLPDGRRVFEHVHAMEQHLGRHLVDGENVHHKNGIKHDNDLGNLELWLVMQPTGQRVEDLMKYITEYHAEAMLAMLAAKEGLWRHGTRRTPLSSR